MTANVLDISHLTLSIEHKTILQDIDLTIGAGETVALIGESGSGKSTLAQCILGLQPQRSRLAPESRIDFLGEPLPIENDARMRRWRGCSISMIFQEPMTSLNPVKRIGWQIEESLRIHTELNKEERYQKAIEMMKEVELPDPERLYRQYPHELSGGMRQRVMIAAAMICNPRILIADEPTTALDVTIQAQIVELLKRMNREKQTSILFISHDLSLVKQLCERVLVMKGGYIVETGLTQEVFAHPKEEYTQRLIAAIPKVERNGK